MLLEEQLLSFAVRQVETLKQQQTWNDMSNDFSHSDGSHAVFKSEIQHWQSVVTYIALKYSLEGKTHLPAASTETLTACISSHTNQALAYSKTYARLLDEANSQAETDSLEYRHQALADAISKHKRLANFYAFILGINHPFPGVDMLPADIPAPNAA